MKSKKTYRSAPPNGATVTDDNGTRQLDPRFDIRNHSPTGFAWGYHGSGPAQLSLALLADALGDDVRAENNYQEFKRAVVSGWQGHWQITAEEIIFAVEQIEASRAA